jgi:hypothetical protein
LDRLICHALKAALAERIHFIYRGELAASHATTGCNAPSSRLPRALSGPDAEGAILRGSIQWSMRVPTLNDERAAAK